MPGPLGMLAAGTAAGIFTGAIENQRQLNQQKKMNEMSQRQHGIYNEMNRQSQLQLWKDTNYNAQMAEIKKAGLNPALLYAGSGAGGTTAAATGGEAQPTATKGNDIITGMGMGLQSGMMQAQIDLIKSQAELARTQAAKIGGVDTTEAQQRITNMQIEADIQNMEKQVKGRTIEDAIDIITAEASRATYEALREQRFNKIEEATVDNTLQQIQARSIGALLDNALTQANIKVADQQIKKLAADIAQGWTGLQQQDTRIIIDKWVAEMKANNPSIGDVFGKLFNNALEEIRNITKPKYRGYKIPSK